MQEQSLQILRCECGINIGYKFIKKNCARTITQPVITSPDFLCSECAYKLFQVFALCKIKTGNSLERFHQEDKAARARAHEETKTMNENLIAIRDRGLAEDGC